jgi:hypothetical protein
VRNYRTLERLDAHAAEVYRDQAYWELRGKWKVWRKTELKKIDGFSKRAWFKLRHPYDDRETDVMNGRVGTRGV